MPRRKKTEINDRKFPPAKTPEARENQLIDLAIDQAEKQLREGTASSQVVVHFLKLASTNNRLEKEKLEAENNLLRAKIDAVESSKKSEELYQQAIDAMKKYGGHGDEE